MKKILIVTAIFEALTGILLLVVPSLVTSLLLGEESLGAVAITITRITGVALITLAIACWLSRKDENGFTIIKAMLFYNVAVSAIIIYCKFGLELKGIGLLPATIIHLALAVWSIIAIQKKPTS